MLAGGPKNPATLRSASRDSKILADSESKHERENPDHELVYVVEGELYCLDSLCKLTVIARLSLPLGKLIPGKETAGLQVPETFSVKSFVVHADQSVVIFQSKNEPAADPAARVLALDSQENFSCDLKISRQLNNRLHASDWTRAFFENFGRVCS
jgi:hypothetical protein